MEIYIRRQTATVSNRGRETESGFMWASPIIAFPLFVNDIRWKLMIEIFLVIFFLLLESSLS
jgi:hypothetical protein